MIRTLLTCLAGALSLAAQEPANFSGVWKADMAKSKFAGPAPANYLMIIEHKDGKLVEMMGAYRPQGEQRSSMTYQTGAGAESRNTFRGLPVKTSATWEGGTLVLNSKTAGANPGTMREKLSLSNDGKTLTVEQTTSRDGRDQTAVVVLEKQPEEAGEPLRKPEKKAGEVFKNVQLLKDVPASSLLETMGAFNVALGVQCNFCHVQGKFDADEKKEKQTARGMITMARNINQQFFNGKMEVRCYTCHQGHGHPQSTPQFQ